MEKVVIRKVLSIGANCFGADFTNALGVREKGPVDNIADFNIWNSPTLFSSKFQKDVFHSKYIIKKATDEQIQKYNFFPTIFNFPNGMNIVHNNFKKINFKFSLLRRIINLKKYYKKSIKRQDYWYVYSLDFLDAELSENRVKQLCYQLPEACRAKLIILAIRARNEFFKKYFKYYLELDNEKEYRWKNKMQAEEIAELLLQKYNLSFQKAGKDK